VSALLPSEGGQSEDLGGGENAEDQPAWLNCSDRVDPQDGVEAERVRAVLRVALTRFKAHHARTFSTPETLSAVLFRFEKWVGDVRLNA
jgi:hypothetical protein